MSGHESLIAARPIAALFVAKGGTYFGVEGVDPWDEERDARLYDGPYPVIAHPPCARWCALAALNERQYGHKVGDDGGCFEAALAAVRTWGGVLEHPAETLAWRAHGLHNPMRGAWSQSLLDDGWTTEVSQVAYGFPARKRTWLYFVGDTAPPRLRWNEPPATAVVGFPRSGVAPHLRRLRPTETICTPKAFRDVLIDLARTSRVTSEMAA